MHHYTAATSSSSSFSVQGSVFGRIDALLGEFRVGGGVHDSYQCQNHCLIHHNVVRHECITCIIIPKDFIYYSIFVSHCMFILTNSYFSLHYCISLYSASSILLHLFFLFFFVSFHPVCFVLTKGPKLLTSTCPFNTSAYSVHGLWALDFFIYICEQFLNYLNITLLFFCCILT